MKHFGTTLLVLALLCYGLSSQASTDKYRLIWVENPSTEAIIAFDSSPGSSGTRIYYGPNDQGINYTSYPNYVDPYFKNYKGMNNAFGKMTGLSPNTTYYFVVVDDDGHSDRFFFDTSPDTNTEKLSIISGGDSRNNRTPRIQGNRLVSKLKPHAVVFTGDMIDLDTDGEWDEWFNDWQETIGNDGRMTPIIVCRGNHEDLTTLHNLFDTPYVSANTTNEYYSISLGGDLVKFFLLNSENSSNANQTSWLANELQSSQNFFWRIPAYHKPMRPHNSGKSEGTIVYTNWSSLFSTHKVKLAIESDTHLNKTTHPIVPCTGGSGCDEGFMIDNDNGTVYIGEGAWGAPLRSANDAKSWTRTSSGNFNQFKWLWINKDSIEIRTIKFANESSVGSVNINNRFTEPTNLDVYDPGNGDDIVVVYNSREPDVDLIFPSDGTSITGVNSLTVSADVVPYPGTTITSVGFYVDGVFMGYANPSSGNNYTMQWTPPSLGSFVLHMVAINNGGEQGYSAYNTLNVVNPNNQTATGIIALSSDDAEEAVGSGIVSTTSSDLELGIESQAQIVGMRFTGHNIPQGATITSASISFYVDEVSTNSANFTFKGELSTAPLPYSSALYNISSRPTTVASNVWTPNPWTSTGVSGADQEFTGLQAIVQEIVDQPGYSQYSGIGIVVTGTGTRTAESYNGTYAQRPVLTVNYSTASNGSSGDTDVSIINPINSSNHSINQMLNIEANATAITNGVDYVEFLYNGSIIVQDQGYPYQANVTPSSVGVQEIVARVQDMQGNMEEDTVFINVGYPNGPETSITSPADGSEHYNLNSLSAQATASDPNGFISSVQFNLYDSSGNLVASLSDSSSPYGVNFTGLPGYDTYMLQATATDNSNLTFTDQNIVNVIPDPCTLPGGWTSLNIGSPSPVGETCYNASTDEYYQESYGTSISGTADSYHFAYKTNSNDIEITARITDLQNPSSNGTAGIMIRDGLSANSKHAYIGLVNNSTATFRYRNSDGAGTFISNSNNVSATEWLKLILDGSMLSGYHSADGANWTLIESTNISMSGTCYVGLASTSNNSLNANETTYDNVEISIPMFSPSCSFTATPNSGSAPVNVVLDASATSDPDGSIAAYQWDYGNGATGLGQVVTASYSAAGSYTVTLTAYDNSGLTCSSSTLINVSEPCTAPNDVTVGNVGDNNGLLNWSSITGASFYRFQYREQGTTSWTTNNLTSPVAIVSNLNSCSTYEYRIKTFCTSGTSSNWTSVSTFSTTGCFQCLAPVGTYPFNITPNSALVAFDVVVGSDSYDVQYRKSGDAWSLYNTPFPIMVYLGLQNCQLYEMRVRTRCYDGTTSGWGTAITFQTACKNVEDESDIINADELYTEIKFWPIPARDVVNVSWMAEESSEAYFYLIDMSGRIMNQYYYESFIGENVQQIKLDNYNDGNYILKSKINGQTRFKQINLINETN